MFAEPEDQSMAYSDGTSSTASLLGNADEGGSGSSSQSVTVARHMTLREKLESLKQQASERFEALTKTTAKPDAEAVDAGPSLDAIQKAVDETVAKLTDPLYRELDYDTTLVFVDDIKSWSGGMPAMLPIVVSSIDARLRNEDPTVAYLALCLIDTLVKNTTLRFHRTVATQPLMSTISRVARGSTFEKAFTGDLRRDSALMWKRISDSVSDFQGQRSSSSGGHLEAAALERDRRRATTKAKEVVRAWGEGFVQTADHVPLFASTYQTLLNEGMDFSDVQLEGGVVLDSPDALAVLQDSGMQTQAVPDSSELIDSAHQTAKLLVECADQDGELVDTLAGQCRSLKSQLASVIEIAIGENDETVLFSALAANEALQESLDGMSMSARSATATAMVPPSNALENDVDQLLFANTMDEVDALLSAAPAPATSTAAAAAAAATTSTSTVDLLDLDFLSPSAASPRAPATPAPPAAPTVPLLIPRAPPPAPPTAPPPTSAPVAPPTAPPAIAPPAIAPPPAPPASTNLLCDDFDGLVLQRKQKSSNTLQEL